MNTLCQLHLLKKEDKWKTSVIKAWLGGEKRVVDVEAHSSLPVLCQNRLQLNLYLVRGWVTLSKLHHFSWLTFLFKKWRGVCKMTARLFPALTLRCS